MTTHIIVKIDVLAVNRMKMAHTLESIAITDLLRKTAGIPMDGILTTSGVKHGVMTWHREEDMDGEFNVITWTDGTDHTPTLKRRDSGAWWSIEVYESEDDL